MTREQRLRAEWEERIPADWDVIRVSDAHRVINRGRAEELVSLTTLYRLAGAGEMGAFGGPGTGVQYRFRRAEMVEYLVRLDVTLSDREPRAHRRAPRVDPPTPPRPDPAHLLPRRRNAPAPAQQTNLFGEE